MRSRIGNISQSIPDDEWRLMDASTDGDEDDSYSELLGDDDDFGDLDENS